MDTKSVSMCWWNHPPQCRSIFGPGKTSKLIPAGSGVVVVLRNLSGRDFTLEPHTKVGRVITANIVPSIQIPSEQALSENEKVECMSAKADLSEGSQQEDTEPEDILQMIHLSGIDGLGP